MIVVSDTSPLQYLVCLGQQEVLRHLFGTIGCPREVMAECQHPHAPRALREWVANPPEWLFVQEAPRGEDSDLSRLDAGEAAAIRLAIRQQATLLLMDERKGRRVAEAKGLKVAGVLSVLAEADIAGLLDFNAVVHQLVLTTTFRVSEPIVERLRHRIQSERRRPARPEE